MRFARSACRKIAVRGRESWAALVTRARTLVQRSADRYKGCSEVVAFAACTAVRIAEASDWSTQAKVLRLRKKHPEDRGRFK